MKVVFGSSEWWCRYDFLTTVVMERRSLVAANAIESDAFIGVGD